MDFKTLFILIFVYGTPYHILQIRMIVLKTRIYTCIIIGPSFVPSIRTGSFCSTLLHFTFCCNNRSCFTQCRYHDGVEIGGNALRGADIVQSVHNRIGGSGAGSVDGIGAAGVAGCGGELDRLDRRMHHAVHKKMRNHKINIYESID